MIDYIRNEDAADTNSAPAETPPVADVPVDEGVDEKPA